MAIRAEKLENLETSKQMEAVIGKVVEVILPELIQGVKSTVVFCRRVRHQKAAWAESVATIRALLLPLREVFILAAGSLDHTIFAESRILRAQALGLLEFIAVFSQQPDMATALVALEKALEEEAVKKAAFSTDDELAQLQALVKEAESQDAISKAKQEQLKKLSSSEHGKLLLEKEKKSRLSGVHKLQDMNELVAISDALGGAAQLTNIKDPPDAESEADAGKIPGVWHDIAFAVAHLQSSLTAVQERYLALTKSLKEFGFSRSEDDAKRTAEANKKSVLSKNGPVEPGNK